MGGRGFKRQGGKTVWPGFSEVEQRHVMQVGRNDPCPCGSGKKYKACHEKDGTPFLEKLALEADRKRITETLKQQGVPWYKRILARYR